ncbi:MAG TPA: ABC transporter ATP-binding protein [Candidatus Krumholzibacteria bacterium]|nr:ABC transporter ATP-binding protein [Candidatus Krumholzibacteria bacterium]
MDPINAPDDRTVLRVHDLVVRLEVEGRRAHAVDGVDLELRRGETLALVGESGCGKSLTALAVLRLLPRPVAGIARGRIEYGDLDLVTAAPAALRRVRGGEIAMIFQEPMTSLNPVFSCGEQIAEVARLHLGLGRRAARDRAVGLMEQVGIDRPAERARQLPHELSGGMRQRVMIAMALAGEPKALLADEPTTALDVTTQAQILDLLDRLREEFSLAVLLVTHDLALAAERAQRVAVMYAGRIVETGPCTAVFAAPAHPYTLGLLACRPVLGRRQESLPAIEGQVPDVFERPPGCSFHPRCPFSVERCRTDEPGASEIDPGHATACFEHDAVLRKGAWTDA